MERSRAHDDGRGVIVSITEAGRRKFEEAQKTHRADLDEFFFDRLSETELRQLTRITEKLLER